MAQYGQYQYESTESRALKSITSDSYNKDQAKNLIQLNQNSEYMAQYLRKLQKGVDEANQNVIEQFQSFINDIIVLLGGSGGATGLDFGDLKYVFMMIGSLFGITDEAGNIQLPLNLFNAAWHFFSSYILPGANFEEVINGFIDAAIAQLLDIFGEVPVIGQAIQQFAVILSEIRDAFAPLITAIEALFSAFGGNWFTGDLGAFGPLLKALTTIFGGITAPAAAALAPIISQISTWSQPFIDGLTDIVEVIANFITLITGGLNDTQDFTGTIDPGEILGNIVQNLIANGLEVAGDIAGVIFGLFGIQGGDQNLLNTLGTNLRNLLGGINFNTPINQFNPITAVGDFLKKVLTPGGALSTWTQIPKNLLGNLNLGQISLPGFENKIFNLLPDPGFADPLLIEGGGAWTWDAKDHTGTPGSGSIKTIGSGIVRQLIGVPIVTKAGDVSDLGAYIWWNGVSASAGPAITLCASAYNSLDQLIQDPKRMVAGVASPTTNSAGYSGVDVVTTKPVNADANGWVHLIGSYQAPPGTVTVRLTLEVESNVSAGNIYYDDLLQSIRGPLDASLLGNVANIPNLLPSSVNGFSGLNDMITTFQHMVDGLGSAYHPAGSVNGIDFTDLFTLAQTGTQNTITALEQAIKNTLQLGNRTNKATSAGVNPTSEAMFTLGHFSAAGAMTTSSLTTGNAISQTFRASEAAKKGFLEFLAGGTGPTAVFVNIYKIDPTTKTRTALWNSPNLATLVPTTVGYVRALIPAAQQPMIMASDLLQLEIVNNSSNPLTVVTKSTAVPNHPADFPTNFACTRVIGSTGGTSPTSLTDGNVTYSGTVPYINFGILDVPADYHAPQVNTFTTPGTYVVPVPSWLHTNDEVDVLGIAGGGGGGGAAFYITGQGGGAANWGALGLKVGVDIKPGTNITVTVGAGGTPGYAAQAPANGQDGSPTSIKWIDMNNVEQTATALGGPGGWNGSYGHNPANNNPSTSGQAAQNTTFNGTTYFGGAAVGASANGQSPGGGAGGGGVYNNGASGGNGQATIVFEQVL